MSGGKVITLYKFNLQTKFSEIGGLLIHVCAILYALEWTAKVLLEGWEPISGYWSG